MKKALIYFNYIITHYLSIESLSVQGDNAAFELILANNNDMFGVQPTEGSESLTAHIYVKNASLIDFDTEPRKYVLHVSAGNWFLILKLLL